MRVPNKDIIREFYAMPTLRYIEGSRLSVEGSRLSVEGSRLSVEGSGLKGIEEFRAVA